MNFLITFGILCQITAIHCIFEWLGFGEKGKKIIMNLSIYLCMRNDKKILNFFLTQLARESQRAWEAIHRRMFEDNWEGMSTRYARHMLQGVNNADKLRASLFGRDERSKLRYLKLIYS